MHQFSYYNLILTFLVLLSLFITTSVPSMYLSGARSTYPPINLTLITKRCRYIVSKPLHNICHAKYPKEFKIKYKDQLVQQDNPFTVFKVDAKELSPLKVYMITFRKSDLHECSEIEFVSPSSVKCTKEVETKRIYLKRSEMHCFPFHVQLIEELVQYCLEYQGSPIGDAKDPNIRSMLHYNDVSPVMRDAAEKLGGNVGGMPFLLLIALLVISCRL